MDHPDLELEAQPGTPLTRGLKNLFTAFFHPSANRRIRARVYLAYVAGRL